MVLVLHRLHMYVTVGAGTSGCAITLDVASIDPIQWIWSWFFLVSRILSLKRGSRYQYYLGCSRNGVILLYEIFA